MEVGSFARSRSSRWNRIEKSKVPCLCFVEFCIKKDPKWGGDKTYTEFEEVEKDFANEVEEGSALPPLNPRDDT